MLTLERLNTIVVNTDYKTARVSSAVNRVSGKVEVHKQTKRGTRTLGTFPITMALDVMAVVYQDRSL